MKFKEDRPFAMPEAAERVRIADSSQTSGLGPKSADIVAKVENRTTLKISRKPMFRRFYRCNAR
jgi:hypothetical protein